MTTLSSSHNNPGLVPGCFYLFQACRLKSAEVKKFENVVPVRGFLYEGIAPN